MRKQKSLTLSKYSQFSIIIVGLMLLPGGSASAEDLLDAGVVMDMPHEQRLGYISGVIEGLAYSRFLRDRPNEDGMKCIFDWYYEGGDLKAWNKIAAWFDRHPDKPVGALLYVLVRKECGE